MSWSFLQFMHCLFIEIYYFLDRYYRGFQKISCHSSVFVLLLQWISRRSYRLWHFAKSYIVKIFHQLCLVRKSWSCSKTWVSHHWTLQHLSIAAKGNPRVCIYINRVSKQCLRKDRLLRGKSMLQSLVWLQLM